MLGPGHLISDGVALGGGGWGGGGLAKVWFKGKRRPGRGTTGKESVLLKAVWGGM